MTIGAMLPLVTSLKKTCYGVRPEECAQRGLPGDQSERGARVLSPGVPPSTGGAVVEPWLHSVTEVLRLRISAEIPSLVRPGHTLVVF